MKKLFLSTLMLMVFACNKEAHDAAPQKSPSYYFTNSSAVVDAIQKYQSTNSLSSLSIYMDRTYGVKDFDKIYTKIVPYFKPSFKPGIHDAKVSSQDSTMASLNTIFSNAGISTNSKSYSYIKEIENIFTDSLSADASLVIPKINTIKNSVANDNTITDYERNTIINISSMIVENYDGLVDMSNTIAGSNKALAGGRTNCWVCSAWRVVRSVVVTVVAAAIIVAAVVVGTVASFGTATPALVVGGLYVGAALGGIWSSYQAKKNVCYYAVNCGSDDSDAAGTQKCSTGQCIN